MFKDKHKKCFSIHTSKTGFKSILMATREHFLYLLITNDKVLNLYNRYHKEKILILVII